MNIARAVGFRLASDHWSPKTAWFCLLAMFVVELAATMFFLLMKGGIEYALIFIPNDYGCFWILAALTSLVICLIFSRVQSFPDFYRSFGLVRVSSVRLAAAAAAGLTINVLPFYLLTDNWSQLQLRTSFDYEALNVLLSPFLEEPILRGFIYSSFRKRYSAGTSTALVAAIGAAWHAPFAFSSLYAVISGVLFDVVACRLRERTGGLLPPIAFHLGFNLFVVATQSAVLSVPQ